MARLRFKDGRLYVLVHTGYILAGMTGIASLLLAIVDEAAQKRAFEHS
jgi:hypothetical protein